MNNKINKNMKNFNYYESELNSLNIIPDQTYKPIIKIYNGNNGNSTKHLSITMKQYEAIKNILIKEN